MKSRNRPRQPNLITDAATGAEDRPHTIEAAYRANAPRQRDFTFSGAWGRIEIDIFMYRLWLKLSIDNHDEAEVIADIDVAPPRCRRLCLLHGSERRNDEEEKNEWQEKPSYCSQCFRQVFSIFHEANQAMPPISMFRQRTRPNHVSA